MSYINKAIQNEDVIPVIESSLFDEYPTAQFAVGIVAVRNEIANGLDNEYQGYALLRGNVYGKQQNFMSLDELNSDGTETDPNDERSIHFAVIENKVTSTRVVGAMRLIIKSPEQNEPLPIEEHYPEVFENAPAPLYSTETSRLISRYEKSSIQRNLKWLLFTAGVSYIRDNNLGPVYGAVEASLARGLSMEGIPVNALAEPKFVEEFNATKMPISIDMAGLTQKMEGDRPELLNAMQVLSKDFVYSGTVSMPINKTIAVA